jgi:hypothetical protein
VLLLVFSLGNYLLVFFMNKSMFLRASDLYMYIYIYDLPTSQRLNLIYYIFTFENIYIYINGEGIVKMSRNMNRWQNSWTTLVLFFYYYYWLSLFNNEKDKNIILVISLSSMSAAIFQLVIINFPPSLNFFI